MTPHDILVKLDRKCGRDGNSGSVIAVAAHVDKMLGDIYKGVDALGLDLVHAHPDLMYDEGDIGLVSSFMTHKPCVLLLHKPFVTNNGMLREAIYKLSVNKYYRGVSIPTSTVIVMTVEAISRFHPPGALVQLLDIWQYDLPDNCKYLGDNGPGTPKFG